MTKEQAMEILKKGAEVRKILVDLKKDVRIEGRQVFCIGDDLYDLHIYDNQAFIELAKALEKPFSIIPDWNKEKGCCKFYTRIDGHGESEWEIFTLYEVAEGWPNAK
jgi:hypothetical protein